MRSHRDGTLNVYYADVNHVVGHFKNVARTFGNTFPTGITAVVDGD